MFINGVEQLVGTLKVIGNTDFVVGVRGHAHEASDADVPVLTPRAALHVGKEFVGQEAELCLFLGNVYLHQDGDDASKASGLLVDLAKQVVAIDGMNEADERGDVLHFVGLQVPNEVPFDVLGQGFVLLHHFLHMTFAEDALSCIVGFLYHLCWMILADGHESDFGGQRLLDFTYLFLRTCHYLLL